MNKAIKEAFCCGFFVAKCNIQGSNTYNMENFNLCGIIVTPRGGGFIEFVGF
jgi:hypothetical protein